LAGIIVSILLVIKETSKATKAVMPRIAMFIVCNTVKVEPAAGLALITTSNRHVMKRVCVKLEF